MKKIYQLIIFAIFSIAIFSCATPFNSGYTLMSTDGYFGKTGPVVQGEACSRVILGIMYFGNGDYYQAMQAAIEEGHSKGHKGNSLVNVKVIETRIPLLVYQSYCVKVEGELVSL